MGKAFVKVLDAFVADPVRLPSVYGTIACATMVRVFFQHTNLVDGQQAPPRLN